MSAGGRLKSAGTKAKTAASSGRRVKVRIAERCVFYVGERAYYAGQVLELPKAEADALLASGQAEPLGSRRKPKEAEVEVVADETEFL